MPLLVVALMTIAIAAFALEAIVLPPYAVQNEVDARGHSFTGTYSPTEDAFIGKVRIVYPDGAEFSGEIKDIRFNGYGVFEASGRSDGGENYRYRFEGNFIEGRLEGEGTYVDNLGRYSGNFERSLPQGQGVYTSVSGWRYEGEFTAGMMTGTGTVYLADGSSASGTFEDGRQISTQ